MQLLQGDCLELMKALPDNSIDLTVTSPPYDNLRTYNGNIKQWSFEKFKNIAKELYRITKDGGVVVWIVADATINGSETNTSFKQALYFKECGFRLFDTMIWNKGCGHPAQFPIQLAHDHIISWSNEEDTILDCFMGSGSTGVAAVNTNRDFIGIELDEHYFEIAKQRIDEAIKQKNTTE